MQSLPFPADGRVMVMSVQRMTTKGKKGFVAVSSGEKKKNNEEMDFKRDIWETR